MRQLATVHCLLCGRRNQAAQCRCSHCKSELFEPLVTNATQRLNEPRRAGAVPWFALSSRDATLLLLVAIALFLLIVTW